MSNNLSWYGWHLEHRYEIIAVMPEPEHMMKLKMCWVFLISRSNYKLSGSFVNIFLERQRNYIDSYRRHTTACTNEGAKGKTQHTIHSIYTRIKCVCDNVICFRGMKCRWRNNEFIMIFPVIGRFRYCSVLVSTNNQQQSMSLRSLRRWLVASGIIKLPMPRAAALRLHMQKCRLWILFFNWYFDVNFYESILWGFDNYSNWLFAFVYGAFLLYVPTNAVRMLLGSATLIGFYMVVIIWFYGMNCQ